MKNILKFFVQHYLKMLAKIVLWRHKPMVVAIAGTTNKTFIKNFILKEVEGKIDIRGNPRSFNTEIGLPLAVLSLSSGFSSFWKWIEILFEGTLITLFGRKFPKVLVLEMGIDCKGDMKYLLSITKPEIAIITNVDRSFPDRNTSIDDVLGEMKDLIRNIKEDGIVFLNGDDSRVRKLKEVDNKKIKILTWGLHKKCSIVISDIKKMDGVQSFKIESSNKNEFVQIRKFGRHNVSAKTVAMIVSQEILKRKDG